MKLVLTSVHDIHFLWLFSANFILITLQANTARIEAASTKVKRERLKEGGVTGSRPLAVKI